MSPAEGQRRSWGLRLGRAEISKLRTGCLPMDGDLQKAGNISDVVGGAITLAAIYGSRKVVSTMPCIPTSGHYSWR